MIESVAEGMAMYRLDLLPTEALHEFALLFVIDGCPILEMAALASALPAQHPADLRADFQRALSLTNRPLPDRLTAARTLKKIYAQRGASAVWTAFDAARAIERLYRVVETELPATKGFVGASFGISNLIELYYEYDEIPEDERNPTLDIDHALREELARIAAE